MKNIVILSGAGISAESGIQTFRDSDGLWENHDVKDVASPAGWKKDRELVLEFYNQRRRALKKVVPNKAHSLIKDLEAFYKVQIITQNIDDLHERVGSRAVLHIHGELNKSRSSNNAKFVYNQDGDINIGDKAEDGAQLRPDIVWFGEDVPLMTEATKMVKEADILVVIGTSMQVYPAAGLVREISAECTLVVVNPNDTDFDFNKRAVHIKENATTGMTYLYNELAPKKVE